MLKCRQPPGQSRRLQSWHWDAASVTDPVHEAGVVSRNWNYGQLLRPAATAPPLCRLRTVRQGHAGWRSPWAGPSPSSRSPLTQRHVTPGRHGHHWAASAEPAAAAARRCATPPSRPRLRNPCHTFSKPFLVAAGRAGDAPALPSSGKRRRVSSSRPCAPSLRKQVPSARPRSSSPCCQRPGCSSPGAAADGKGVWGQFAAVCQSTPSCPEKMRDAGWSSSCGRGAPPPPRQHRTLLPGAGFGPSYPSEATGGDKFPRRLCQVLGRKRSHRTLLRLRAAAEPEECHPLCQPLLHWGGRERISPSSGRGGSGSCQS